MRVYPYIPSGKAKLPVLSLLVAAIALLLSAPSQAQPSCPLGLNSPIVSSNGQSGVTLEITASKSTSLCRFWIMASTTGSHTVQIWRHPNGVVAANDGLWTFVGQATISMPTSNVLTEVPVDLNDLLNTGQTVGYAIFSSNTIRYSTTTAGLTTGNSYLTLKLAQWGITGSTNPAAGTTSWSFGFTPRGFVGEIKYKEGCFFPSGNHALSVADASGNPLTYSTIPGQVYATLSVNYPAGAATVTSKLEFFRIGGSTTVPEYVHSFVSQKQAGQALTLLQAVPIPGNLQPGFYRVVPTINAPNSCGTLQDLVLPEVSLMLIYPNSSLCVVYPGDVNDDGAVNYSDRKSLNQYIQSANMRSSWLQGPARYRADAATNPMTYLSWQGQAGIPWQTPDGCYMDADGNGVINSLDYLAIKFNWMRSRMSSKQSEGLSTTTFALSQNYPNPFNPSTTLTYSVPERSAVRLVVTDLLGREVASLVDRDVDAGVHSAQFGSTDLASGSYIATVRMTGLESGLTFSKTIRMTLAK